MKLTDVAEALPIIGCFYLGFQSRSGIKNVGLDDQIRDGFVTVIGYKLATSWAGTIPVSQIAGLAMLASVGIGGVTSQLMKQAEDDMQKRKDVIDQNQNLTDEQKSAQKDKLDEGMEYLKKGQSYDALNAFIAGYSK